MLSHRRMPALGRCVVVALIVAGCSGNGDSVETTSSDPSDTATDGSEVSRTTLSPVTASTRLTTSTTSEPDDGAASTTEVSVGVSAAKAGSNARPTAGTDGADTTEPGGVPTSETPTGETGGRPDDTATTTSGTVVSSSTTVAPPSTTSRVTITSVAGSTSTVPATTVAASGLQPGYVALDRSSQFTVFLGGSPRNQDPCGSLQRVTAQIGSQSFGKAVVGATVEVCVVVPDAVVEDGAVVAGGIAAVSFTNANGTVRQQSGGAHPCEREGVVTGEPVCYSVGKISPGAGDVGTWTVTVERADGYAPMIVPLPVYDLGRPTVIGGLLSGFPPGSRPRLTAVFLGQSYGQRADGSIGRDTVPTARATTTVDGPLIGADGTAAWTPPFLENPVGLVPPDALGVDWQQPCFVAAALTDCGLYFRT